MSIIHLHMNRAYELWGTKIMIDVILPSRFRGNTRIEFLNCILWTSRSILYVNSSTVFWRNLHLIPDIDIRVIRETRWLRAFEIAFEIIRIPLAFRDIENSLREKSPVKKEAAVWYEFIKRRAFLFFRHKYAMLFRCGSSWWTNPSACFEKSLCRSHKEMMR